MLEDAPSIQEMLDMSTEVMLAADERTQREYLTGFQDALRWMLNPENTTLRVRLLVDGCKQIHKE